MATDPVKLKKVMEEMIVEELARLRAQADVCVFALYDPARMDAGPIDFYCLDRKASNQHQPPIALTYEGIGVWYFAFRTGDTFHVRKILLQISNRRFVTSQVGDFEGYWDDFPTYVAEDRWVHAITHRAAPANDGAGAGPAGNTAAAAAAR